MLSIGISVQGNDKVLRKLKKLGDSANDHRDAMREIGRQAVNYYGGTAFTDRGRPWGKAWADWSPAYKKWREKHFAGHPMLMLGGKGSEHMQTRFFAKEDGNSVTIGNSASYYKYHQSSAPRSKIPRRQMAGINGNIKDIVKNVLREDLRNKLDRV